MSERCQWEGCTNASLPHLPPGNGVCADHIKAATKKLDRLTADLNRKTEVMQLSNINQSLLPWYDKPGRWLPWVLFVIWFGMTVYYLIPLGLAWFIFMPIAWLAWQFGTNNTSKHQP